MMAALQHVTACGAAENGESWQTIGGGVTSEAAEANALRHGFERYLCADLPAAAAAFAKAGPHGLLALAALHIHHGHGNGALSVLRTAFSKVRDPYPSAQVG
jgi:hypothetical protein